MNLFNNSFININFLTFFFVFLLIQSNVYLQQESMSQSEIEDMQDVNMNYLFQTNEIVKDYSAFSYSYSMKD